MPVKIKRTVKNTGIYRTTRQSITLSSRQAFAASAKLFDTRPLDARLKDIAAGLRAILVEQGAKFRPKPRTPEQWENDRGGISLGSEIISLPKNAIANRAIEAAQTLEIVLTLRRKSNDDLIEHAMRLGKLLDMVGVSLHEPDAVRGKKVLKPLDDRREDLQTRNSEIYERVEQTKRSAGGKIEGICKDIGSTLTPPLSGLRVKTIYYNERKKIRVAPCQGASFYLRALAYFDSL